MRRTQVMRRRKVAVAAAALVASVLPCTAFAGAAHAQSVPNPAVGMAVTRAGDGYFIARADGTVTAHFRSGVTPPSIANSLNTLRLNAPIVAIATTPTGRGYYLAAADGGVFALGDAQFRGSMGGTPLNSPIVSMAVTPTGAGYYLAAADGGIFAFGDAVFRGSVPGALRPGQVLQQPVEDMALLPNGAGYYLLAKDGGVFAFNATFRGSRIVAGLELEPDFSAIAVTASGGGYRLIEENAQIFPFGTAPLGITGNNDLVPFAPRYDIVDMVANPVTNSTNTGWYALDAAGGVFAVGVPFYGSAA